MSSPSENVSNSESVASAPTPQEKEESFRGPQQNDESSDSDTSSGSDGEDFVRRIASKLVSARFRKARRYSFRDTASYSVDVPYTSMNTHHKSESKKTSTSQMVDSECNTCDNTVTIDRREYQQLQERKVQDEECMSATYDTGFQSTGGVVFLNLIVDENGNSTELLSEKSSEELNTLKKENDKMKTSLKQTEFKSSLVKSERLLLNKQFQMIQSERDEMNTYIKAITGMSLPLYPTTWLFSFCFVLLCFVYLFLSVF